MKKRIIILGFLLLLLAVGGLVYYGQWQAKRSELYYSGIIEAKDARLAFQASGRVVSVAVREGQAVFKDQVMAELDPAEFSSRREQAQAALDRSKKNREQLETVLSIYEKTLPEDVVRAEAAAMNARKIIDDARKNRERYDALYTRRVISEKERDAVKLQSTLRNHV